MHFRASAISFVSLLPHWQNLKVPFEDFFHLGKQEKSHSGRDQVNREGGAWGHAVLGQKLLNTVQCGQVHSSITHCEMGECVERVFKKNSLKPNTGCHNNVSWYTDTDGFLEHSPSRGSLYYKGPMLQKIIICFLGRGAPSYMHHQPGPAPTPSPHRGIHDHKASISSF